MGLTSKVVRNEKFFLYTWKYFQQRTRGHKITQAPIFLVGCGHSGTSVLLRLLGMHSNIYAVPYESRVFMHNDFKQSLASKIWNRNAVVHQKHRWVEKTPVHVRKIDKIFSRYPDAKIVFIVRDGRDVTVSMRKRFGSFEKGLRRWVDDNRQGLDWVNDSRVMMVRYEDLVKAYDQTMPKICAFVGEAYEEDLTNYYEKPIHIFYQDENNPGKSINMDHNIRRNQQINQKLFDGSGKWKTEMTAEEKAAFKADSDAMEVMTQLGYTTDAYW